MGRSRTSFYDRLAETTWEGTTEEDAETRLVRDVFSDLLQQYNGRVLNLGCGNFERACLFSHFDEIVGIDLATPALRDGRERYSAVEFVKGDAERLPFSDGEFDVVFTDQVLEHLPSPGTAIQEISRVGDAAIVCVPNDGLWSQRLVNRVRGYDPERHLSERCRF